ncbi:cellulose biosynthesis cyclic di-GMP-binding regulatory protein BcsB [Salipiger sp. 1_MG-2023]|uniref:cellulose biosynthesis cyclic di-GMP-binding regulatory protein BcsB n=1 Tax=Salipiger sp. 1_MG-2023 TaxID=3062665 RepID=UPI0026E1BBE5|nr:cellulose biosynthesis cyclic di-GMP-binding regulatory protein BcsB [Salipiger sp. 1_MG-2023]MDO6587672.1 cellulose biosynthesis cyclic di-GMP-binding regulatory protein BcsB [Salipiger sp. 1_MG-2023]
MTLARLLIGVLAFAPGVASAQSTDQEQPAAVADATAASITRTTTLADLGFGDGLTFRQLSGQSTVFVPVPDTAPLRGGTITLDLKHGATVPVDRYLQISVGARVVSTQSLGNREETLSIPVPFGPADVANGFLAVSLSYSGAFSDRVCIDERASGDFLQISPASSITLELDADGINSPALFAGFRPGNMRIALPDQSSLGGLAAATRAAALFGGETGSVRFGTDAGPSGQDWTEGAVQLDIATSGVQSEMQVLTDARFPHLTVRGTDPQLGLWQLASNWAALAGGDSAITTAVSPNNPTNDVLALSSLNADLTPRLVVSTQDVLIPFESADLPAGKTVASVDLMMAAALDAEGRGATASVYLNETLLGNRPLPNGVPERLTFNVPRGLIGRDNLLRVSIQRQPSGGECRFKPQGYPAQILPGSTLRLADADDGDDHFFTLRQDFGEGVQLVLDPDLDLASALPWISGVAGTMIPDRATILPRASVSALEPGLPFFVISQSNPGDGDPAIDFDSGRVEIRNRSGELMFAGDELDRIGVAQIVTRGDQTGLWLRPGAGPAPEPTVQQPLVLNRGDLALLDQKGVIVATGTRVNPVLDVAYPDRTSLAQILAKYRPWIVGGAWLLLTLLVLIVFQRIYRNRRNGTAG